MNAKGMIMKRSTVAKTFTIAAVTALALGLAPVAKADDKGCSNATLKGTFAFTASGFITAPAAAAGPLAEVGAQTFDGNGGASAIATSSQNGNIHQVTITGTYTVNPDCTGTLAIQAFPGGLKSQLFFVIDDTANELLLICTDPGFVLTGIARRQFPRGDPRQ
jgi:hypothetical protein